MGRFSDCPFPCIAKGKGKVIIMVLKIGGNNYTIEFSIEASLCNECTEKVTGLMVNLAEAQSDDDIKGVVKSIADVPQTALTMFYAGLIENHSDEIKSMDDAKQLVRTYFKEHKEDGTGNFYALMELMIEQMGNDDFFNLIGLEKMFQTEEEVKPTKTPQDHKKKTTTKKTSTEKVGEK